MNSLTELWLLVRWMAETVVTSEIENEYFELMPQDALAFLYDVGQNLVAIFG